MTYYKGAEVSGTYYLNKNITTAANINITMGTVEAEGNYYVTVGGAGNKNGIRFLLINSLKNLINNKLLVFYERKLVKFFTKM